MAIIRVEPIMPLRLTLRRTQENVPMISKTATRFLAPSFRLATRVKANQTAVTSLGTDANALDPKILRILIVLVQINLEAPHRTDQLETKPLTTPRRITRQVPSGPACHHSALCAIAELIPRSLAGRKIQIPEIPWRSTVRI
jgi:hypothetical protein